MSNNTPTAEIEAVAEQSMRLSPDDRAEIAGRLLMSVSSDTRLHPRWGADLGRRVTELDAGVSTSERFNDRVRHAVMGSRQMPELGSLATLKLERKWSKAINQQRFQPSKFR